MYSFFMSFTCTKYSDQAWSCNKINTKLTIAFAIEFFFGFFCPVYCENKSLLSLQLVNDRYL